MVAAPVVDVNDGIASHGWSVTTAAADVRYAIESLFWAEPHARLAAHVFGAMLPGINGCRVGDVFAPLDTRCCTVAITHCFRWQLHCEQWQRSPRNLPAQGWSVLATVPEKRASNARWFQQTLWPGCVRGRTAPVGH